MKTGYLLVSLLASSRAIANPIDDGMARQHLVAIPAADPPPAP